jgi:hypothetical protein
VASGQVRPARFGLGAVVRDARIPGEGRGDRARLWCGGARHPQRSSRRSVASARAANVSRLGRSEAVVAAEPSAQKRGDAERLLKRLVDGIDHGRSSVRETQKRVERYVDPIRQVDTTWDPANEGWTQRQHRFDTIRRDLWKGDDAIRQQRGGSMTRFRKGLFAGGSRADLPRDNLDLERWFRLPEGHERRIHGRRHAGVRIVQEGATLMLTVDAHRHHPQPFTEELHPYRDAVVPESQREAIRRRKVIRSARSTTKRGRFLRDLEKRYAASS